MLVESRCHVVITSPHVGLQAAWGGRKRLPAQAGAACPRIGSSGRRHSIRQGGTRSGIVPAAALSAVCAWLSPASRACAVRRGARAATAPDYDQSLTGPGQRVRRRLLPGTRSAQCPGPARPHAASHPEVRTPAISPRARPGPATGSVPRDRRASSMDAPQAAPCQGTGTPIGIQVRRIYPVSKWTGWKAVGIMSRLLVPDLASTCRNARQGPAALTRPGPSRQTGPRASPPVASCQSATRRLSGAVDRCYRPSYLNIQRPNYLWTIRHSSARIAGNLIT